MLPQDAAILAQLATTVLCRVPIGGSGGEAPVAQLAEASVSNIEGCRFESCGGYVKRWWIRVQPWCRFCGWRWRMWWLEYDYQCEKHWSPDALAQP